MNFRALLIPLIFFFFLALFCAMQFITSNVFSQDDLYYHIAHAHAYWTGEWRMNYPIYSLINSEDGRGDVYFLYHLTLAPFTAWFDGDNYEALILGAKAYHALLFALFFTLFFSIARSLLLRAESEAQRMHADRYALMFTFFLFFVATAFTFRLMVLRPQVVSVLFMLCAVYFLVRKKFLALFATAVLFPLWYSISFVLLFPAIAWAATYMRFHRPRASWVAALRPAGIVAAGLAVGVALHPEPLHYLMNGYWANTMAVFNVYVNKVPEGLELGSYVPFDLDWLWRVPFVLLFGLLLFLVFRNKGMRNTLPFEKAALFAITLMFFVLMVFIKRAAEYFFPAFVLSLAWIGGDMAAVQARAFFIKIRDMLGEYRRHVTAVFWMLFAVYFCGMVVLLISVVMRQPPTDAFRPAAEFLLQHSQPGDLVFNPVFDQYPRLVFYNNKNRYAFGMGMTFTYTYDPRLQELWYHLWKGDAGALPADPYTVIRDTFGARYVFVDERPLLDDFIKLIRADARFEKVFTDNKNPGIAVYRLR